MFPEAIWPFLSAALLIHLVPAEPSFIPTEPTWVTLIGEAIRIGAEIAPSITQLYDYIDEYNDVITNHGVNVINNIPGEIEIQFPADTSPRLRVDLFDEINRLSGLIYGLEAIIENLLERLLSIEINIPTNAIYEHIHDFYHYLYYEAFDFML